MRAFPRAGPRPDKKTARRPFPAWRPVPGLVPTRRIIMSQRFALEVTGLILGFSRIQPQTAVADGRNASECGKLPSHAALKSALIAARNESNGGFNLDMRATIVNRDGVVRAVAFTGDDRGDQWPGSRVIPAQKASTANAFSLPGLALSTANVFSAVQPGVSLYGLQHSNPVDTEVAYRGSPGNYGQPNDPMVSRRIGGVNVFGGGLGLYNSAHELIGAVGVSGNSSCADHHIAWRTKNALFLDYVPGGVSGDATRRDNIVYDISNGVKCVRLGTSGLQWRRSGDGSGSSGQSLSRRSDTFCDAARRPAAVQASPCLNFAAASPGPATRQMPRADSRPNASESCGNSHCPRRCSRARGHEDRRCARKPDRGAGRPRGWIESSNPSKSAHIWRLHPVCCLDERPGR